MRYQTNNPTPGKQIYKVANQAKSHQYLFLLAKVRSLTLVDKNPLDINKRYVGQWSYKNFVS